MTAIEDEYRRLCAAASDINEHLPTLRRYASEVSSVAEMGIRGVVSSWALAAGLLGSSSGRGPKAMTCLDIDPVDGTPRWQAFARAVGASLRLDFVRGDSASTRLTDPVDLLFIDTFHIYGHLRRELDLHAPSVRKYIILHDTTVDAVRGEALRMGMDLERVRAATGYSWEDLTHGLVRAVAEFVSVHPEWAVHEVFHNNNGLTVLKKETAPE